MTNSSINTLSDAIHAMSHPAAVLLQKSVYVRKLTTEECSRRDVIRLIQEADEFLGDAELYGVFDQNGILLGAGKNRSLAVAVSIEHGFEPQEWLI